MLGAPGDSTLRLIVRESPPRDAALAGIRICAFTFDELQSPAERPYGLDAGHKYAGQEQALPSRIWDEADGDLP